MHTILDTSQLKIGSSQGSFPESVGGPDESLECTVGRVLFDKHPLTDFLNDLGLRNVWTIDWYINLKGRGELLVAKLVFLAKELAKFSEATGHLNIIERTITIFINDVTELFLMKYLTVTILSEDLV